MERKKFFDANKHTDKQQDTFTDELLSEATLENVTGGDGGTCGHQLVGGRVGTLDDSYRFGPNPSRVFLKPDGVNEN